MDTVEDLGEQGHLVLTVEDSKMTINYIEGKITLDEYNTYLRSRNSTFASNVTHGRSSATRTDIDDTDAESVDLDNESMSTREERVPRSRLPKDLLGLVGEANMMIGRGEFYEAIAMCTEAIRLVPNAHEPYQTLSNIYEEEGDMEKSLQCGLLGAYLSPRCVDEWLRLAEMAMDMNNAKQAAICYRNYVKYDRSNVDIMWTSVKLDLQLKEHRRAAETLKKMLEIERAQVDGEFCFQVASELARIYHTIQQTQLGIACLKKAFEKHPSSVTCENVNLLAELYVTLKMFTEVIQLLCQVCGVVFDGGDNVTDTQKPSPTEERATCTVPHGLPIDLRTKLVVSLIHIRLPVLAQSLLGPLLEESPEDMGDLYLDVAEAYLDTGCNAFAKPILEKLVNSPNYSNMVGVWLYYADCTSALGELETAVKAYSTVAELKPTYVDARVSMSLLLQRMGLHQEALDALRALSENAAVQQAQSASKYAGQESRLVLHTCLLLHSRQRYDEFIEAVQYLLFGQFPKDYLAENSVALMTTKPKHYFRVLVEKYGSRYKLITEAPAQTGASPLTTDEMWDLFMQACRVLDSQKDYIKLRNFSLYGLSTAKFASEEEKCKELCFICLVSQIILRNGRASFYLIRDMVKKDFDNHQLQNILAIAASFSKSDNILSKFTERLLQKHPDSPCLRVATGNVAIAAGSYRAALGHYMAAHQKLSDSALLNLLIGVTFIHMASQSFATERPAIVVQGCGFLQKYAELRGNNQEAWYNLGRAMQQIGLYPAAIHYYEKAIAQGPTLASAPDEDRLMFDLTKEAAFNMAIIFQNSGADTLAKELYQRYCVV